MTVTNTQVTISLTATDRAANYIPSMDGYRLGAAHEGEFVFEIVTEATPEQIAESVYVATNAPMEVVEQHPTAKAVYGILERRFVIPRSLSVGDLVIVKTATAHVRDLTATAILECSRIGFTRILGT